MTGVSIKTIPGKHCVGDVVTEGLVGPYVGIQAVAPVTEDQVPIRIRYRSTIVRPKHVWAHVNQRLLHPLNLN